MSASPATTIAFLGASNGCGLAALEQALAAGHTCVALCRNPSRLASAFGPAGPPANLAIVQGNARDPEAVASLLAHPTDATALVDAVHFSIGGTYDVRKMAWTDRTVCQVGAATVLAALEALRGVGGRRGRPHLVVISSKGISDEGRDIPLALIPLYHGMLRVPHEDKKAMEDLVRASAENWTIVRPTLLINEGGKKCDRPVRVGVEGRDGVRASMGYWITREEVGRWVWGQVLATGEYKGEIVGITF